MNRFPEERGGEAAGADDSAFEQAALHALGALDAKTAEAYEARLRDNPTDRAMFESLQKVVHDLGLLAEPKAPPQDLLARLQSSIHQDSTAADSEAQRSRATKDVVRLFDLSADTPTGTSSFFQFGDQAQWQPTLVAGVESRTLFTDEANGRATMLFRMAPGTSYPAHRHTGPEECFVLEGDLQVGDVHMQKGDYQFAAPGSVHPEQSTTAGCTLLITTSLHDEVFGA